MVSDVNRAVARVRAARTALRGNPAETGKLAKVEELAAHLITPAIRYSKPELQTHIRYLYSLTTGTDQKIGKDAVARFNVLKKNWMKRWWSSIQFSGLQDSCPACSQANEAHRRPVFVTLCPCRSKPPSRHI